MCHVKVVNSDKPTKGLLSPSPPPQFFRVSEVCFLFPATDRCFQDLKKAFENPKVTILVHVAAHKSNIFSRTIEDKKAERSLIK